MTKWLPQPLLSLLLLLTWLLLSNSSALGHVVLGALLGWLIPLLTVNFWPERTSIRKPGVLLAFIGRVLIDIVIANWAVAIIVLTRPSRSLRPALVELPLDLRSELAITLFANTISLTPGTVSADLAPDRSSLLIHCLDLDDEIALIADIKSRYEAPLKEVFESC